MSVRLSAMKNRRRRKTDAGVAGGLIDVTPEGAFPPAGQVRTVVQEMRRRQRRVIDALAHVASLGRLLVSVLARQLTEVLRTTGTGIGAGIVTGISHRFLVDAVYRRISAFTPAASDTRMVDVPVLALVGAVRLTAPVPRVAAARPATAALLQLGVVGPRAHGGTANARTGGRVAAVVTRAASPAFAPLTSAVVDHLFGLAVRRTSRRRTYGAFVVAFARVTPFVASGASVGTVIPAVILAVRTFWVWVAVRLRIAVRPVAIIVTEPGLVISVGLA